VMDETLCTANDLISDYVLFCRDVVLLLFN
jgi:hypothetical protein